MMLIPKVVAPKKKMVYNSLPISHAFKNTLFNFWGLWFYHAYVSIIWIFYFCCYEDRSMSFDMQQEVPWTPVSCVPLSFIGDRLGLGRGLTRVNLSLVTAKKTTKHQNITANNNHCNKSWTKFKWSSCEINIYCC